MIKILGDWQPDLIYSNNTTIDIGFDISKYIGVPHVWHIREFGWDDYSLSYFGGKNILYNKINKSNLVIFISESLYLNYKNIVAENYIILKDPITNSKQKKLKIKNKKSQFYILVPGIISKKKGQIIALRAFHIFSKKHKQARIFFLGSGGRHLILLKIYTYLFNLKNVYFLGYRKQIEPFFRKADIVLICSKKEALGRVTLEAMMYGAPIIGSDTGGTRELIGKNRGLTFDGSYKNLYKKMEMLINNKLLMDKYSKNGIDYINKFFLQDEYIKKIETRLLLLN